MMLQTINLTERNSKLAKAVERKHFLTRGLSQKNVSQEQYDKEIPEIEKIITECTLKTLKECKEYLQGQATSIKKDIPTDGDMKRAVANLLIEILKPVFPRDEIRGIMRQGYKIMRSYQ